mmetsp:Transcript_32025/g.75078  ORF Transcript_32025/g.75078 Transcript_32025/m.75078 type:complete len:231 (+) Transcript_32025:51-743(+)
MGNCSAGAQEGCCATTPPKVPGGGKPEAPPAPLNDTKNIDVVNVPLAPGLKATETFGGVDGGNDGRGHEEGNAEAAKDDPGSQTVLYSDNSTYTGQMVNGRRQGYGLWQSRGGQYDGQWRHDIQHGFGKQRWSDGRLYEGQFEDGKFSGEGKMVWITQRGEMTYEGQYKDDVKHGRGKFTWADGRVYDGEWCQGKRHGRGHYTNNKEAPRIGFWQEDKFERWETDEEGLK